MMKKILCMFLSALLLLSLFACGAEDTEPKDNNTPDIPVDDETKDDEQSEDDSIPFDSGFLATWVGGFYPDITSEEVYMERKDEISHQFVTVLETYDQCIAPIVPDYWHDAEDGKLDMDWAQKTHDTISRYTDVYLAEKQVIAVTRIEFTAAVLHPVVKELTQNEDGTYRLVVAMDYNFSMSSEVTAVCNTITIEVDKSLGITPQNLTVEFVAGNPIG